MEQSEADLGQQYRVKCVGFFCGNSEEGDLPNKPSFLFDSSEKERARGEGKHGGVLCQRELPGAFLRLRPRGSPQLGWSLLEL